MVITRMVVCNTEDWLDAEGVVTLVDRVND